MRIAFFIDNLKEGVDGVANTSHHIINRLKDHSIEPIFITALLPENPDFPYPVFQTRYLPLPYWKDIRFSIPSKRKIFKILDDFKPDLIHWSTPSLLGKIAVDYATKYNVPNVTIYHTHIVIHAEYFKWLPFKKFFIRRANRILGRFYMKTSFVLAPTQEMKNYLTSIGVSEDKILLWGRGVDCELFNPAKRKNDYFDSTHLEGTVKLLFVSRLVNYKETDSLIKLSHILPSAVDLVIVGEGPEKKKMEEESKAENTLFLGWLVGEYLAEAFASCDLFVFPSLSETFGNVVLEALASGLPVVAANRGGPKSIISQGETGYLTEPKDVHDLLEKIKLLTGNKDQLKRMSINARNYAESQSWSQLVRDLITIYKKLVTNS